MLHNDKMQGDFLFKKFFSVYYFIQTGIEKPYFTRKTARFPFKIFYFFKKIYLFIRKQAGDGWGGITMDGKRMGYVTRPGSHPAMRRN